MTAGTADTPQLRGSLYTLPFSSRAFGDTVMERFRTLAAEHGVEDVLVLKRFPSGITEVQNDLREATETVVQPRVLGLSSHAHRVLEELFTEFQVLDQSEQRVLLNAFVSDYEWQTRYLRRAADTEGFVDDVGRFIQEATWQGSDIETVDPVLAELAKCKRDYHEWLEEQGYLDPANATTAAIEAMGDPANRDRVQTAFDAVLVLEFEEFTGIDREYLAHLTAGLPLVCVAQRDSAIQRTWNEPGPIEAQAPGLELTEITEEGTAMDGPEAVARLLGTGQHAAEAGDASHSGTVTAIQTQTFEDQIGGIADEIERLRREEDVPYDECAVILRDANAPIPETVRQLRSSGIPVSSATVGGLEHDPAARELYALVSWCCHHGEEDAGYGWDPERALAVLDSRVGTVDEEQLDDIHEIGIDTGLEAALNNWILTTDLKARLAGQPEALAAVTQFDHVEEIRSVARFIDETPLIQETWPTLCESLEREIQRASSDRIETELDEETDGVLVDAARVLKNRNRQVVFLLNVVDRDYPAEPHFTPLFPTPHIESLAGYPAFTDPSAADVHETFRTAGELTARPLMAYYAELSRRILAVGARTATERLYFSTYREDSGGTGSNLQPSRFLTAVEDALGELPRVEHDGLYSHGSAVEFALTRVDTALRDVRRAGVIGDPIPLDDRRTDFATVQAILEADTPPELRHAVRARVDFAKGAVRRE